MTALKFLKATCSAASGDEDDIMRSLGFRCRNMHNKDAADYDSDDDDNDDDDDDDDDDDNDDDDDYNGDAWARMS